MLTTAAADDKLQLHLVSSSLSIRLIPHLRTNSPMEQRPAGARISHTYNSNNSRVGTIREKRDFHQRDASSNKGMKNQTASLGTTVRRYAKQPVISSATLIKCNHHVGTLQSIITQSWSMILRPFFLYDANSDLVIETQGFLVLEMAWPCDAARVHNTTKPRPSIFSHILVSSVVVIAAILKFSTFFPSITLVYTGRTRFLPFFSS